MAIAMTGQQKDDLERKGYFVVENLLSADETAAVSAAMDQVAAEVRAERGLGPGDKVALRNGMIRHPKLLDLMDHPAILELVVDAYGWNIHNRDSVTQCEPPRPDGKRSRRPVPGLALRLRGGVLRDHRGRHAAAVGLQGRLVHLRPHRARPQHHPGGARQLPLVARAARDLRGVAAPGRHRRRQGAGRQRDAVAADPAAQRDAQPVAPPSARPST